MNICPICLVPIDKLKDPVIGTTTHLVSMRSYSQPTNPCVHGFNYLTTPQGDIQVKDVFPNMQVYCYNKGQIILDHIECIVRTSIKNYIEMVKIDGLFITAWHPVYYNKKWQFPQHISPKENIYCKYIYSFVMKNRSAGLFVNKIPIITLGHGGIDRSTVNNVAYHHFWSTDKVIQNLKEISKK